jgi:uracil phosphoribosyltransferase
MTRDVHVLDHPLIQHKLTLMRRRETSTTNFRRLLNEIGALMAYEVTRDMPMHEVEIETPLERMTSKLIEGKKLVFVPILRAGTGRLDGFLNVVPGARVGHIGLYREPKLHTAVEYYLKLPHSMSERDTIVISSVLATGGTAAAAVRRVRECGARSVRFACLVASQRGVDTLHEYHPDVPIYTCAVDEGVDEKGFITPGLGDVGDRLYGTE